MIQVSHKEKEKKKKRKRKVVRVVTVVTRGMHRLRREKEEEEARWKKRLAEVVKLNSPAGGWETTCRRDTA